MPINPLAATGNGASNISMQSFLKILTSQLQNQDPLKPTSNEQFIAQIAQFASLQQTQEINQRVEQLQFTSSVGSINMLGKSVRFADTEGVPQDGVVSALSFETGRPLMTVKVDTLLYTGITIDRIINLRL